MMHSSRRKYNDMWTARLLIRSDQKEEKYPSFKKNAGKAINAHLIPKLSPKMNIMRSSCGRQEISQFQTKIRLFFLPHSCGVNDVTDLGGKDDELVGKRKKWKTEVRIETSMAECNGGKDFTEMTRIYLSIRKNFFQICLKTHSPQLPLGR